MYKNIKAIFLNWRLWLIIAPPIIIWLLIFPYKIVELANSCGNTETPLLYTDITGKPTLTTLIADTLQIPLNLKWYNLYFRYNVRPRHGWIMTEPMILMVSFNDNSPFTAPYGVNPMPMDSIPRMGGKNVYQIPANKDIYFYYSGNNNFSCRAAAGGGKFERDPLVPDKNVPLGMNVTEWGLVKIIAKTNVLAWIFKLLFLFLLWFGLILLMQGVWNFISKNNRK